MRWMLPDGVEEWLPPASWALESLRRQVIDLFARHGFDLIEPPLVEYTDSLLSGVGSDLEQKTFAVTDQINGRRLGFRADITPQAARIDANRYADDADAVRRLCYVGTVLRTQPLVPGGARSYRQVGAEIFGHAGAQADMEVLALMLALLGVGGQSQLTLDLGHVGIFKALLPEEIDAADRDSLIQALQRKAVTDLSALAQSLGLSSLQVCGLEALCTWHGPVDELATKTHPWTGQAAQSARDLLELAQMFRQRFPGVSLHLDSGELSGFHYETGVTWAAYAAGRGRALARGGRYDGVGEAFGAARPATGFSADLNALLADDQPMQSPTMVWAPAAADASLEAEIGRQRDLGVCVRRALPGEDIPAAAARLVLDNSTWVIK
nr:ATP phosphoribosyltransferase regulatory subunit [Oceanococcus sp. HetDA_MAG_MS8]